MTFLLDYRFYWRQKCKLSKEIWHVVIWLENVFKVGSPFSECESRDWHNSLSKSFFQSSFEANKLFCLLNKFVLFTNQKQYCVQQKQLSRLVIIRRMFWCRLSRLIPAHIPLKTANVEFQYTLSQQSNIIFTDVCTQPPRHVLETAQNKNLIT